MSEKIKFFTLDEVAEILQVHYQHVYSMVRKGEMPALRIGKLYRIMETDFNDYLVRCRTSVGSKKVKPTVCSICGKEFYSAQSITSKCAECGAPICKACAGHGKTDYCEVHAKRK